MRNHALILCGALLLASAKPGLSCEFAEVDPALLAKGVQKLADAWTIPTVVFIGATDDFAKDFETLSDNTPVPASAMTNFVSEPPTTFVRDFEGLVAEFNLESLQGTAKRRRRLDD